MTLKLALRNVRRSARDYAVYFLTLALGVAMFYAFNSISSQAVLFDALSAESQRILGLLNTFMGLFSGAVAFVLAFLVVYANRFLLKRRKREFGMYLTLGMSAGQVSRILLVETALVGVASLAAGLVAGIAISQGMSFATAALMGTTMTKYRFIVSGQAALMTLACFAGIFVISALVDVAFVSRRKLADLISQHEASERTVTRGPLASALAFAAAVALLGCAYWQLSLNGLVMIDEHFIAATVLMIAGTVLFFWSVAGFALALFQRSKRLRYTGLASFTMRQLSSKVNTAFASMAVVCVMLFLAGTTLAGGLAMTEVFAGNIQQITRYDATITTRVGFGALSSDEDAGYREFAESYAETFPKSAKRYAAYGGDAAAYLAEHVEGWDEFVAGTAQLDYYTVDASMDELLEDAGALELVEGDDMRARLGSIKIRVLPLAQFNAALALLGEEPVELAGDEFLVNNTMQSLDAAAAALSSSDVSFELAGACLHSAPFACSVPMRTSALEDCELEIVVPQGLVDALVARGAQPSVQYLDIAYSVERSAGDAQLREGLVRAFPAGEGVDGELAMSTADWPVFGGAVTGLQMADQASGLRMVITYLAVYIGFILMLTTAALLAIQQLSETTDSLPRYRRLSTLGASRRMVLRSLLVQTCAYFVLPLLLACCHSACALTVLGSSLFAEVGLDMGASIGVAAAIILGVYAVYLAVAYLGSRNMVAGVLR